MSLFLAAVAGAAIASFLLVRFAPLHLRVTADLPGTLPQKVHMVPTPRVGGLAVVVGLFTAVTSGYLQGLVGSTFVWAMVAALLPAFLGGFVEDLTRRIDVTVRLLMTLVSAAIAFVWLDANLYRSDIAWLDAAFRYWPLSFAGTLLAVAGLAHAMNIIDGYNGLSAGVGMLSLLALSGVASEFGDVQLASIGFAAAGSYCGFLLFNFPFGRIFQGDGGAYLLGATLAILSAQLVGRHTGVSPWFPLALVVYPVWETLFSMLRRVMFERSAISAPDANHLHSMLHRCVMRRVLPAATARGAALSNAATTLPLWAIQLALVGLAVTWRDETPRLILLAYGFIACYCVVYAVLAMDCRRAPA